MGTIASNTSTAQTPPARNSDELIYSTVKERVADQFRSVTTLDTKAALTLSFTAAVLAGLVNSKWFLELNFVYHVLLLLCFGLSSLFALASLLTRKYRQDPDPAKLIAGFQGASHVQTMGNLIISLKESYEHNARALKSKNFLLNTALVLLTVSVIVFIVALFFSLHNVTIK